MSVADVALPRQQRGVTEARRELTARAQALRAEGKLQREIADALGVSRSYAAALLDDPLGEKARTRKDRYAGACADCGAPTSGSNGPANAPRRCFRCAEADPEHKIWTPETVVEAVQRWATVHGRPPLSSEWLRVELRGLAYPSTTCVFGPRRPFASWADAIEAAGFPRPTRGSKRPRGTGASNMARLYHVLHRNGDGGLHETTVEAYSPENAIEKVADAEGEWIAVLDSYWFSAPVEPVSRFAVVKT